MQDLVVAEIKWQHTHTQQQTDYCITLTTIHSSILLLYYIPRSAMVSLNRSLRSAGPSPNKQIGSPSSRNLALTSASAVGTVTALAY